MDNVNHPKHYTSHPSGIEAIQITEHMNFCLGNAVKYILRCDMKGAPMEDLHKAIWYIKREIQRREREANKEVRDEVHSVPDSICDKCGLDIMAEGTGSCIGHDQRETEGQAPSSAV